MQALIEHKGKQFLVEENSEFKFPYLGGKVGEKFELEKILYIDDSKKKEFGKPYIQNLSISGEIISHGRDDKIVVFKMKRRKGHQKKNGHKQHFTTIEIKDLKSVNKTKTKKATTTKKIEKSKD